MSEAATTDTASASQPPLKAQSQALLKQLMEVYPAAFIPFSERIVKPLKLGIHKDLKPIVMEWGFEPAALKIALSLYTRALRYQVALLKESHRVDLKGEPAGDISDANRETARAQIKVIKEKRKQQPAKAHKPRASSHKAAPPRVSADALAALQKKFAN